MTAPLPPKDANRLARICALFASSSLGERAAAASAADRLVKDRGLSWHDVIAPTERSSSSRPADEIDFCLRNAEALTDWEFNFLHGIKGRHLSARQREVLDRLTQKCRARREGVAA